MTHDTWNLLSPRNLARIGTARWARRALPARLKLKPFPTPARKAESTDAPVEPAPARKPVIALALGSGGARGYSHIGVLRALQAAGIAPDIVVGTSMGAVVGAAYAAGALDQLEAWSRSLNRRNMLGYLDLSFAGAGLIGGGRLAAKMEEEFGALRIEDLPIRFAAVATDVRSGREVWLDHGRLVTAVRASYAIPGIFTPVHIDHRWLVDGALVNPVPVSTARAFGADIVIAVNLNTGFDTTATPLSLGARDTPHPTSRASSGAPGRRTKETASKPKLTMITTDSFNVMQNRITQARLTIDPADVVIEPPLEGIGWFDFHRGDDAILRGRRAGAAALDAITAAIARFAEPEPVQPEAAISAPHKASAAATLTRLLRRQRM